MGWMIILAVVVTVFMLAFANGTKDNAKGVATLIGSRSMLLNKAIYFAAVMLAAGVLDGSAEAWGGGSAGALILAGLGIALGGVLAVKRVARTMSYRITEMNDGQAFAANFVTAGLVIVASKLGVRSAPPTSVVGACLGSAWSTALPHGNHRQGSAGLGDHPPRRGRPGGADMAYIGRVAFDRL